MSTTVIAHFNFLLGTFSYQEKKNQKGMIYLDEPLCRYSQS